MERKLENEIETHLKKKVEDQIGNSFVIKAMLFKMMNPMK